MIGLSTAILLTLLMFSGGPGHEPLSEWKSSKTDDDIEISYRKVLVGDTLETREMRITFEIEASSEWLIEMFRDPEAFLSWSTDVTTCDILDDKQDEWIMYKTYDLPWPISSRDIVNRYSVHTEENMTVLDITTEEGWVDPQKKVKRIDQYEAHWHFHAISPANTYVEYTAVELSDRPGPRILVDGIVESSYLGAIKRLKEKSANQSHIKGN